MMLKVETLKKCQPVQYQYKPVILPTYLTSLKSGTDPGGAGSCTHSWDRGIRTEGAGSFISRAERTLRHTGVP